MKPRQTHMDVLKLMASQFVVLHHFAAYGPLADALGDAFPRLTAWFYDYARMAVQVFLVLGGYLAARSLASDGLASVGALGRNVVRRYLRLAWPFGVAMLLAVVSGVLARHWLNASFLPAAPTWGQVLAHALLLHGVLGVDALSAGVWYVAIDFQLFTLMAGLLWLGGHRPWVAQVAVLGFMLASLFFFNRDAAWDNGALYFFGAYGMGAVAWWAGKSTRPAWLLGLLALTGLLALVFDFRERIALACVTALLLGLLQGRQPRPLPAWLSGAICRLGQSAYALFLVHFSVLMLANALLARLGWFGAWAAGLVLLLSWLASVGLALLFERWVEKPLSRRL